MRARGLLVLWAGLALAGCGGGSGGGEKQRGPCERGVDDCSADATCADAATPAGFTCTCNAGFTGDGVTCTPALGPCEAGTDDCSADATCADAATPAGFTCTCNAGFTGDGVTCADIDECASGAPVEFVKSDYGAEEDCITQGVCITRGDQFPIYNSVVEGSGDDTSCDSSPAPTGTLWALGACSEVSEPDFGAFLGNAFASCMPPSVVDVPGCLELVAEHRYYDVTFTSWSAGIGGGQTSGGGFSYVRAAYQPCGLVGACTNTPGAYTCSCQDGYTFDGTTCVDVDECAGDPCGAGGTCINAPGAFTCQCPAGYAFDGATCADVDECAGVGYVRSAYGVEQDAIAPSVTIARQDTGPIYNALVDAGGPISCGGAENPTGTRWALGTCADVASSDVFGPFLSASFANCGPQNIVGVAGCLEVTAEGQLHDITIQSYTGNGGGGGLSYTRQAYCPPTTFCVNTPGSFACIAP